MEENVEKFSAGERENKALERSKDKLKRDIDKLITAFFGQMLDIAEVAIGDGERHKAFRRQVLRGGNDAIRDIKKILDKDYRVLYTPSTEDVVEVNEPSLVPRKISRAL